MYARAIAVLEAPKKAGLKKTYGKGLTSAVLSKISAANPPLAQAIHDGDNCYRIKDKVFKPLTHSDLTGLVWNKENRVFEIPENHCTLYVGWRRDVVESFLNGIQKEPVFRVNGVEFKTIIATEVPAAPSGKTFKFSGPVVATKINMKKVRENPNVPRCHFTDCLICEQNPDLFKQAIKQNLLNKYEAVNGKTYEGKLEIKLPHPRGMYPAPVPWGKIDLIGNYGHIELDTEPEMLQLAFAIGLGKMNSLGYGMAFAV